MYSHQCAFSNIMKTMSQNCKGYPKHLIIGPTCRSEVVAHSQVLHSMDSIVLLDTLILKQRQEKPDNVSNVEDYNRSKPRNFHDQLNISFSSIIKIRFKRSDALKLM